MESWWAGDDLPLEILGSDSNMCYTLKKYMLVIEVKSSYKILSDIMIDYCTCIE